jgi:hypothetical protein
MLISDEITDSAFDIMILTETWHTASTDLHLCRSAPAGYCIVDAPRPRCAGDGVNHGGIAIIHRDTFSSRAILPPLCPTSFELLLCFMNATERFVIVCIYRPSSQRISDVFFEEFTSLLRTSLYLS